MLQFRKGKLVSGSLGKAAQILFNSGKSVEELDTVREARVVISCLKTNPYLIRRSNIVEFIYTSDANPVAAGDLGVVGTLPVGYRPTHTITISPEKSDNQQIQLTISADGKVNAYNYGTATGAYTTARYHFTFIANI